MCYISVKKINNITMCYISVKKINNVTMCYISVRKKKYYYVLHFCGKNK